MIFFGHVGITVGVIHRINKLTHRKIDLRKAALIAVLPDLLDKPLGIPYRNFFHNNTRLYGHTILFAIFVLILLLGWQRLKAWARYPFIFAGIYAGHQVLDRMWLRDIEIWCWPVLGPQPPYGEQLLQKWAHSIVDPYNVAGELIGISILVYLCVRYQLYVEKNLRSFLKTGHL